MTLIKKKKIFVYKYEAYKSDTGIHIFYAKLIVGDISLLTWRHVRHEQSNGGHVGVPAIPVKKKTLHMWLLSCVAINWVTCLAAGHVSENALFTLPGQEFKQYWPNIEISINIK